MCNSRDSSTVAVRPVVTTIAGKGVNYDVKIRPTRSCFTEVDIVFYFVGIEG